MLRTDCDVPGMGIPKGLSIEFPKLFAGNDGKGGPAGRGMPIVPRLLNPDDMISVVGKVVAGANVDPKAVGAAVVFVVRTGLKEPEKEVWSRRLNEDSMGLNRGGAEATEVTWAELAVMGAEELIALGISMTTGTGGTGTLPISEVVKEEGGGMPKGIPDREMLGGGTAGGGIDDTNEPRFGIGTGRGGIVGIVGIVGIMRYIAVPASEVGGFGPTASMFNSPDSSFM